MDCYREIFREPPPFIPDGVSQEEVKPRLIVCARGDFARRIGQLVNVFDRSPSVQSVALLQINEDETEMALMRQELDRLGVRLAPSWELDADGLITSSVERVKGLEFDACILVGLDSVARSSLKHTENRVYVGLSRPMRRLVMLCERTPDLFRNVSLDNYERIDG
jgi:superfamily I DNA/RNA helicase